MIPKSAIAVYNPQDPVERAFQDAYHGAGGRYMTAGELKAIKRCLPTYRGLVQKVARSPEMVAKALFAEENTSNLWYYPCDVIDLRQILGSKQLSWHAPIMLFSPKTARRLMPEYPICLVFDRTVTRNGVTLGGVHLKEGNRLDMADSLNRIMIRDYLSQHQAGTIYNIIRESMGFVPTYLLTDLPGVNPEPRKVAAITHPEPPEGFYEAIEEAVERMNSMHMNNWYEVAKQKAKKIAEGPSDTFGKEFLIGKQPKTPDPDEVATKYELPHRALSLKKGDRVAYRYTNVKLPVNNQSGSMPMTRSLVQTPKTGTIQMIDSDHIHIKWDDASEVQKVPVDQEMFLIKVHD